MLQQVCRQPSHFDPLLCSSRQAGDILVPRLFATLKGTVFVAAQAQAASRVKVACLLNLALMEQRSERFSECFSWCDKALRCAPPWRPSCQRCHPLLSLCHRRSSEHIYEP